MTRTKNPVVLVHGVFGYGRKRPFWNRWLSYWPERALQQMDANYLLVDVGALSSDHDRACEAFYQLYGGRVDYGEAHACQYGHGRFGETFEDPLYPNWSEHNPIHLVGHSVGATTAIELYQLLCQDFFAVGSNHTWVTSIVSIAGPLSGTTLTHFFGFHAPSLTPFTLGHVIGASLCLWNRLHTQLPWLKNVFDCRMPQWEFVTSYWEIVSTHNRILLSPDLAVFDILPAQRLRRNQTLQRMDKPFLVSVVTSSSARVPTTEIAMAVAIAVLALASGLFWFVLGAKDVAVACAITAFCAWLWLRKRIFLPIIQWRMRHCVQQLHDIFDGFDRSVWEHNDGAVNICSMVCPQQLVSIESKPSHTDSDSDVSTASSTSSGPKLVAPATRPLKLNRVGVLAVEPTTDEPTQKLIDTRFEPGLWYVHTIASNHKAGTNFDRASPMLFRHLLHLVANEFEK